MIALAELMSPTRGYRQQGGSIESLHRCVHLPGHTSVELHRSAPPRPAGFSVLLRFIGNCGKGRGWKELGPAVLLEVTTAGKRITGRPPPPNSHLGGVFFKGGLISGGRGAREPREAPLL